jgi:carbamoyl-phosphate synthase small subunit
MYKERQPAALILDDGAIFHGKVFGHSDSSGHLGEIVFNTSMSGYQEIITDPSYRGQIVCFTYPSIGNYGVNINDSESDKPYLNGIVVREYCEKPSNHQSVKTLEDYMLEHKITGITEVDTRALVRHIREKGSMKAGIFPGDFRNDPEKLKTSLNAIQNMPNMEGLNLTDIFNGNAANSFIESYIKDLEINTDKFPKIAVLDFGIKFSILKHLIDNKMMPVVFPGDTPMDQWKNYSPDQIPDIKGYFLSNGPGDPAAVKNGIENIKKIISFNKPVFGICLGHQMLSIALGAKTFKLKFGHHGGNQPVKKLGGHNVMITAQNHGFAAESSFFTSGKFALAGNFCEINPNDQTFEGFYLKNEKILSVQYHPEAGPGPNDALVVFHQFKDMVYGL